MNPRNERDRDAEGGFAVRRMLIRILTAIEAAFIYLVIVLGLVVAAVNLLNR